MIDKAEIERVKAANPMLPYIRGLGIKVKKRGKQYFCRCPLPNHLDEQASCSVDAEKEIWHCFGCDAGGDIYSLVMAREQIDFREAHRRLGGVENNGAAANNNNQDHKSDNTPVTFSEVELLQALTRYINHYHHQLLYTPAALDYLRGRAISQLAITTFQLGYVDESIVPLLTPAERAALTQLGVITNTGRELMAGCVIFPLCDAHSGQPISLYGRATAGSQHLYLPGKRRGIVNSAGAKNSNEVIITESVIDALALWSAGITNVLPIYGTQGLTDEIIAHLKECRVERVILMMDSDRAGELAATRISARLATINIVAESITLPAKDPAEFIAQGASAATVRALIKQSRQSAKETISNAVERDEKLRMTKEETGAYLFVIDERCYRIRGLSACEMNRLKVTVQLQSANSYHIDNLDLYSAKARERFAEAAEKRRCGLAQRIETDLCALIEPIDNERLLLRSGEEQGSKQAVMTEQERAAALDYLRSPNLTDRIVADIGQYGLISERANVLLGYLAALSRKLAKPLSTLVVARTGAGKSSYQEAICAFVPPEDLIWVTRLTGQALFYKDPDSLKGKVLAIAEEEGAAQAIYSLRTLASDQKLAIAVTQTNPQTGEWNTKHYIIHGPVSIITTTTSPEAFDEETRSRFVLQTMNESQAQTQAILARQRQRHTLAGVLAEAQATALEQLHHNIQRLLRPIKVVNPYVEYLHYPANYLLARREQQKYLTLIDAIALLHQHQREIKHAGQGATEVEYVEVELADIALANELAEAVLSRSFDEMAPPVRNCLAAIQDLYQQRSRELGIELYQVALSRREIRAAIGWTDWQVRIYCQQLVEMEYLYVVASGNGKPALYKLIEPLEETKPSLLGLASVEQLREQLKAAKKKAKSSLLDETL